MRRSRATLAALGALLLAACAQTRSWREELDATLPLHGHRNWIAVVDAAYPLQVSEGVRTVLADAQLPEVVRAVLAAVDASDHVRALVFVDRELSAVSEADAPGIDALRARLDAALAGRDAQARPHEEILAELDEAGRAFDVLVLKTPLALPYTSVFVRLECGYWSDEAEQRLRARLAR